MQSPCEMVYWLQALTNVLCEMHEMQYTFSLNYLKYEVLASVEYRDPNQPVHSTDAFYKQIKNTNVCQF